MPAVRLGGFGELVQCCDSKPGIHLAMPRDLFASFLVPCGGVNYILTLAFDRGAVALALASRIRFPLYEMPDEIVDRCRAASQRLRHCELKRLDLNDSCAWAAQAIRNVGNVSSELLQAIVAEEAACIQRLDAWLLGKGYY